MWIDRQDFCEDIVDVVAVRDEDEGHDFVGDLFTQPRHFDTEVSVSSCDHMVGHHGHAGLIVLT